jgi:hypothetical protein
MCFVFSHFLTLFPELSYNSFVSIYFLALFQQPFNVFNNLLASFVLFFVFFKPLCLECPRAIPLFLSHPANPAPACDNVSITRQQL